MPAAAPGGLNVPLVKPLSDLPKALRSTSPDGFDLGGELTGSALSPSLAGLNGRCVPLACPPSGAAPFGLPRFTPRALAALRASRVSVEIALRFACATAARM